MYHMCKEREQKRERGRKREKLSKSRVDMANEQTDYDTACIQNAEHFQCLYLCTVVIMLSKGAAKQANSVCQPKPTYF